MRPLAVVFVLAVAAIPAQAREGTGARVAETFARPALAAFKAEADRMNAAVQELCAEPSSVNLTQARARFDALAIAWGRVSVLRFGPLAASNRFERIFFWPDPRGAALRQVQQVLAQAKDVAAPDALAGASVAIQGLPALEFALEGTGAAALATTEGAHRCAFAQAVAANVAGLAGETMDGWREGTAFAGSFTAPSQESDPYRSAAEVDGEILKAMSTALQFAVAAQMSPAFGADATKANGRRAPLWRSGLSFDLVSSTIAATGALMDAAGFAERLPADRRYVTDSIRFELAIASRALEAIALPPEAAFADATERGRIGLALLALNHARDLMMEDLPAALGLTMGFNALDGD